MNKSEKIKIKDVFRETIDDQLVVSFRVRNDNKRTMYIYGRPRRIQYDKGTKTLVLTMHDNYIDENSALGDKLKAPPFLGIAGEVEKDIDITLPKVIKRIKAASEGGEPFEVEMLEIHEAENIVLEVAQHDTPFYYKSGKENMAAQLKKWGKVVSKTEQKLSKRLPRKA